MYPDQINMYPDQINMYPDQINMYPDQINVYIVLYVTMPMYNVHILYEKTLSINKTLFLFLLEMFILFIS